MLTLKTLLRIFCSGSTIQNKQMFNIICELPETVARTLVPRIRVVKGTGKAINYLTPPRILLALITAWLRRGRWFDDQVMSILCINVFPCCSLDWGRCVLTWMNLTRECSLACISTAKACSNHSMLANGLEFIFNCTAMYKLIFKSFRLSYRQLI